MKDSPLRILVVEDNPVTRTLLQKDLEEHDYRVSAVENGKVALNILKKEYYPIIVTDWMMPEMDGLELCRAIRKRVFPGYVFILLLTAKDSKKDIVVGLDAGADDYLTKPFDPNELMARLRAGQRILKLEKALKQANEENRILSITDPLTGAYNRRYLMDHLPKELSRARRYVHPLTIIMADIDDFKKVNDQYGHQAGDLTLKKFVESVKGSVREEVDWLARYGGEEFLIVLPETDQKGAYVVAERLRLLVSQMAITAGRKKINITASFGIFTYSPSKEQISLNSFIDCADKNLYQAKTMGKNRVVAGVCARKAVGPKIACLR